MRRLADRLLGGVLALLAFALVAFVALVLLGVVIAAFAALQLLAEPARTWSTVALSVALVVLAVLWRLGATRQWYPRITDRDRLPAGDAYAGDAFTLWKVNAWRSTGNGPLARADILEAALVEYDPTPGENQTQNGRSSYGGTLDVAETKPVVRLRLRVRPEDAVPYETSIDRRVPSVCLAAVTAGRLAVRTDPDHPAEVVVDWSRSTRLAGVDPYRVAGPDGLLADLTGRPDLMLEQMRTTQGRAGLVMTRDTLDARDAGPALVEHVRQLAERAAAGTRAPVTEPAQEVRWLVDQLPGQSGEFGRLRARWVRRGGGLARARLLELRPTDTFQTRGPVLETVLRVHPDADAPFEAGKRMTLPMNYLALLHRTKDVVVRANPGGRSFDVDWPRTNLLAGATAATVIGPDGRRHDLTGQADLLWAVMRLLVANAASAPGSTLDLRRHPPGLAAQVMHLIEPRP